MPPDRPDPSAGGRDGEDSGGAGGYDAAGPDLAGVAGLPGVVGVGVDLCDVGRLRQSMARTPSMRDRLFTADEQAYCERRRDPAERYAVRFAAKEAVLKAMGVGLGSCSLRDIEVVSRDSGQPVLVLHESAAALAAEHGITRWHISLTHTSQMAQATVIAVGPGTKTAPVE